MNKGVMLILFIIIVLSAALYFTFVYSTPCDNLACWETKLEKCGRAKYLNDAGDVAWQYKIEGKAKINGLDKCIVNVKLADIRKGSIKTLRLKDQEMQCAVPLGVISYPETNIESCSGQLKEGMQSLIIEQLYQYILDNIGTIGTEITNPNVFSGNENTGLTTPETNTLNNTENITGNSSY
ncbi:hypothetical protein J4477_03430 [Candidatus Pacearchaeota archaeon]|nr:hypothetical protein [Candidatus Pacearchaeota archaeon]